MPTAGLSKVRSNPQCFLLPPHHFFLLIAELSRINGQLESREAEVADLTDCLARLSIEAEGRGAFAEGLARQKADQDVEIDQMRRELAAKDELVRLAFRPQGSF